MKIKEIKIKNFRSIREKNNLFFNDFNILIGQNNHGKTNFFDALNWFFNGFARGEDKKRLIFLGANIETEDILVEIIFTGLQEAIENIANSNKKTALQNIFGSDINEITIRRTTGFENGKKRQLYNPVSETWENTMGADGTWNDLLPHLEYVHTKTTLDDIGGYKNKSPISEMLSGVLTSIIETDEKYIELKDKFKELFGDDTSEVRTKLNEISGRVEVYLKKQFPDNTSVKFNVDIPEFADLLKKFSTEINDGVPTLVEEKGDGIRNAPFTEEIMSNILERLGVNITGEQFRPKNVAAVLVTANLPPFARTGSRIDVTVSAIGDAKSLADDQIYTAFRIFTQYADIIRIGHFFRKYVFYLAGIARFYQRLVQDSIPFLLYRLGVNPGNLDGAAKGWPRAQHQ